jgi:hypothetical protein
MPFINSHGVGVKIPTMYGVFSFHTLVIGAKFLKELDDMVKSGKKSCFDNRIVAIAPMHRRTHTSPCDSG